MNPRRIARLAVAVLGLLAASASGARAQLVNGDFESDVGWTPTMPPGWSFFYYVDVSAQRRYGWIQAPPGAGLGCVAQTFTCGAPGGTTTCRIGLELTAIDQSPDGPTRASRTEGGLLPSRFRLFVDGILLLTSEFTLEGFQYEEVEVPCGQHELRLCLEADPANEGVSLLLDNAAAACEGTTPTKPTTWGTLKLLYR